MEKYYVIRNDGNLVLGCSSSLGGEEITKEEYEALLTEIRAKTAYVNKLYNGEITLDNVPTEWQAEIQHRVDDRIKTETESKENAEATIEDYHRMLAELGVVL